MVKVSIYTLGIGLVLALSACSTTKSGELNDVSKSFANKATSDCFALVGGPSGGKTVKTKIGNDIKGSYAISLKVQGYVTQEMSDKFADCIDSKQP